MAGTVPPPCTIQCKMLMPLPTLRCNPTGGHVSRGVTWRADRIILETDPAAIRDRVLLKGAVPESMSSYSEMTVASVRWAGRASTV